MTTSEHLPVSRPRSPGAGAPVTLPWSALGVCRASWSSAWASAVSDELTDRTRGGTSTVRVVATPVPAVVASLGSLGWARPREDTPPLAAAETTGAAPAVEGTGR